MQFVSITQSGSYYVVTSNRWGCSNTSEPLLYYALGEASVGNAGFIISVFPNPAADFTMINHDASFVGAMVYIKDITGRQLLQAQLKNSPERIPIAALPAGVYLVTAFKDGLSVTRLLVKE